MHCEELQMSRVRALMMEEVRISETSVCFNETIRCYIAEGCHLNGSLLLRLN
jgi:hypothetical protein